MPKKYIFTSLLPCFKVNVGVKVRVKGKGQGQLSVNITGSANRVDAVDRLLIFCESTQHVSKC